MQNHVFDKADYAKEAIRLSIKEQLDEGRSIDDVNLFELKNDYSKISSVAPIYARYKEKNSK